jgi:hypothetical protein
VAPLRWDRLFHISQQSRKCPKAKAATRTKKKAKPKARQASKLTKSNQHRLTLPQNLRKMERGLGLQLNDKYMRH